MVSVDAASPFEEGEKILGAIFEQRGDMQKAAEALFMTDEELERKLWECEVPFGESKANVATWLTIWRLEQDPD